MKNLLRSLASGVLVLALLAAVDVSAQWTREGLACVRETGEVLDPQNRAAGQVTVICEALSQVERLGILERAAAAPPVIERPNGEFPVPGGGPAPGTSVNRAPTWLAGSYSQTREVDGECDIDFGELVQDPDATSVAVTFDPDAPADEVPGCELVGNALIGSPTTPGVYDLILNADDGGADPLVVASASTSSVIQCWPIAPAQIKTFGLQVTVSVPSGDIETVLTLASEDLTGAPILAATFAKMATPVRFQPLGVIDAYNGVSGYQGPVTPVTYAAGSYTVVIKPTVDERVFDAWAAPVGDPLAEVASRFDLRNNAAPGSLNQFCVLSLGAPHAIANAIIQRPVQAKFRFTAFAPEGDAPEPPAAPFVWELTPNSAVLRMPPPPAPDHQYFKLYGRTPENVGTYTLIATNITASSYLVSGLTPSTTYRWYVTSVDIPGNESAPGASVSTFTTNVDYESILAIPDVSATEGNSGLKSVPFTLQFGRSFGGDVTCVVSTVDDVATAADNDYVPLETTITLPMGQTSVSGIVQFIGDTNQEPHEPFILRVRGCAPDLGG